MWDISWLTKLLAKGMIQLTVTVKTLWEAENSSAFETLNKNHHYSSLGIEERFNDFNIYPAKEIWLK